MHINAATLRLANKNPLTGIELFLIDVHAAFTHHLARDTALAHHAFHAVAHATAGIILLADLRKLAVNLGAHRSFLRR